MLDIGLPAEATDCEWINTEKCEKLILISIFKKSLGFSHLETGIAYYRRSDSEEQAVIPLCKLICVKDLCSETEPYMQYLEQPTNLRKQPSDLAPCLLAKRP